MGDVMRIINRFFPVSQAPFTPKKAVAGVLAASLMVCAPAFAFDADTLADGKRIFNGNCGKLGV